MANLDIECIPEFQLLNWKYSSHFNKWIECEKSLCSNGSKMLSAEQKELKKEICSDLLQLLYPKP